MLKVSSRSHGESWMAERYVEAEKRGVYIYAKRDQERSDSSKFTKSILSLAG